jgi:hypothetical protein
VKVQQGGSRELRCSREREREREEGRRGQERGKLKKEEGDTREPASTHLLFLFDTSTVRQFGTTSVHSGTVHANALHPRLVKRDSWVVCHARLCCSLRERERSSVSEQANSQCSVRHASTTTKARCKCKRTCLNNNNNNKREREREQMGKER